MSWFAKCSLPNVSTPDKYYYVSSEAANNNFFKIAYGETVTVDEKDITEFKGNCLTIFPKEIIKSINPAKDFTIDVNITLDGKTHRIDKVPLGTVLTNETLKSPEYLTHAIILCGRNAIDMGESFLILSNGLTILKFTDLKVIDKLNDTLNDAIFKSHRGYGFVFNLGESIEVNIGFSAEAYLKFTGKNVGNFYVPIDK